MQKADPLTQSAARTRSGVNPPASTEPKEGETEEGSSMDKNVNEEEMETAKQLSSIKYVNLEDTDRKA